MKYILLYLVFAALAIAFFLWLGDKTPPDDD